MSDHAEAGGSEDFGCRRQAFEGEGHAATVFRQKIDNGAPVEVNGGALIWGMSLMNVQFFLLLIWEY
jgi:hypothetical protein